MELFICLDVAFEEGDFETDILVSSFQFSSYTRIVVSSFASMLWRLQAFFPNETCDSYTMTCLQEWILEVYVHIS